MSKSMVNFAKGIVTGIVVGTTVSMCVQGISKQSHSRKKGAGKMIKNIGTVMNHFNDMMR